MRYSIIVAKSENNVIGVENTLPWHLPEDLKHFKSLTMGKPMIMGRLTYESIGKPLPGRISVVVSKSAPNLPSEVCIAESPENALEISKNVAKESMVDEVMVVGGARIYQQFLPLVDRLYVTEVHTFIEGDAYFPELADEEWRETARVRRKSDAAAGLEFSFVTYERVRNG